MNTREFQTEVPIPYPVPVEVLYNYGLEPEYITKLGGGLINTTYLAEMPGHKTVLQKLSPVMTIDTIADADIYSRHLEKSGWEAPLVLPTRYEELHHQDAKGNLWRQLKYIESQPAPFMPGRYTWQAMGSLLGRWHKDMAELDYRPRFAIPHFHDAAYHATRLGQNLTVLSDSTTQELANRVLNAYQELPDMPSVPLQLLHGDPKQANILYRFDEPLTFIDLDTVMHGSVWLDIGDMNRSALSASLAASSSNAKEVLHSICKGYYRAAEPGMCFEDFYQGALSATRHITLELAMRYLNDIVDDNYFGWDTRRFTSRRGNHASKASSLMLTDNWLKRHNKGGHY